jgi:hypothetical protein
MGRQGPIPVLTAAGLRNTLRDGNGGAQRLVASVDRDFWA